MRRMAALSCALALAWASPPAARAQAAESAAQSAVDPAIVPVALASGPAAQAYDFDIAPLPLVDALKRYGEITGYSFLYETRLIQGRASARVHGRLNAEQGLAQLLAGAGLESRFVNSRSIMLTARLQAAAGAPLSPQRRRYDAQVQARVAHALCAHPETGAGRYRIALRFSVDDDARLTQLRVRVAARPELEPAVARSLDGLVLGLPPAEVARAVVMVVQPDTPGRRGCAP